jgi:hypothetical protein
MRRVLPLWEGLAGAASSCSGENFSETPKEREKGEKETFLQNLV